MTTRWLQSVRRVCKLFGTVSPRNRYTTNGETPRGGRNGSRQRSVARRSPRRQAPPRCRAMAGTAALPRGSRGTATAAGGDGGRHRTPGDGGRLPGVSAVAAGAGAVVLVAAWPLVPRQWKRRRRRRLCFGHEPAAWPRGERDILAKSIHSTTANCFSSWKGGFDAFPYVGSDNGNRSVAVSVCFTDRSSF